MSKTYGTYIMLFKSSILKIFLPLIFFSLNAYAGKEYTSVKLSGKKPAELNIHIKVKFKTIGNEQGCKTESKLGLMVPLKKSKTYSVSSIDSDYSIVFPLNWTSSSRCEWKVYRVEIKPVHMAFPKSRGVTGFLYYDINKKGKSFLGSTTIYCQKKYIGRSGAESKGISCRDPNAGDKWVYFYNGFLNKDLLEYQMNFVYGDAKDAPSSSEEQEPESSMDDIKEEDIPPSDPY